MKQCSARSKRSSKRCKNYALKGMNVCRMHGGNLGSNKAKGARASAALKYGFYTKESVLKRKLISKFMKDNKQRLTEFI